MYIAFGSQLLIEKWMSTYLGHGTYEELTSTQNLINGNIKYCLYPTATILE